MKVSDYIALALARHGVRHVFELSGGMITHLLDSIYRLGRPQLISMHHEQAAAFAADAVGRLTGIPGVALATSGPGATNLLTGIGSCYFDSSPAVFITGQVNRNERKGSRAVRQLGFQETDIVAVASPLTKAAWEVSRPEEVPDLLDRAFARALEGRPGPVLIDIPMDVQRAEIEPPVPAMPECASSPMLDEGVTEHVLESLLRASRPLILVGGGVRSAPTRSQFRRLVDVIRVPVVNSLMAVDALPYGHPFRVGLIGTYGNRWANHALAESDCLLVLGSRLDVRQTGSDTRAFKGGRQIIHVDCDAAEINNRVQGCEPIVASVEAFIETALVIAPRLPVADRTDWSSHIAELAARWPDTRELEGRIEGINPNVFMHALSRSCSDAAAYIVDVGQHQMWAAQSLELGPRQRFMTSGGMGSMGFALPAAIGACLALDRQPVVCIAGDGGLQCNVQELETLARLNLPVKIAVLNNRCLGMVRQFQETYFEGRYQSTAWGYGAPSFVRIVEAYGVQAARLESPRDAADRISWLCSDPHSPALVEVAIDITANAYPKTSFGHPLSEMEPEPDPASSVTEIASAKHRVEDSGRARMPLQAG